jgi:hypothetical protein
MSIGDSKRKQNGRYGHRFPRGTRKRRNTAFFIAKISLNGFLVVGDFQRLTRE